MLRHLNVKCNLHKCESRRRAHQGVRTMAKAMKMFYDLTAKLLSGEAFNFASLKGKVVLIENVASL